MSQEENKIELDIELLRNKRSLYIATPMYGGQCTSFYSQSLMSLSNICRKHGIEMKWASLNNESLITRARNYMVDGFLESTSTHMMFIDADIQFNPYDVLYMLQLAEPGSDYNIISGVYPKKNICWEKVALAVNKGIVEQNNDNPDVLQHFVGDFVFNPLESNSITIQYGVPVKVRETGTGFMMIERSVFDRFKEAHPELIYTPDHVRMNDFDGSKSITAYFNDPLSHMDYFRQGFLKIKQNLIDKDLANEKIDSEELMQIICDYENLMQKERRHLSEDYYFSREVIKLGMNVWICPWMQLNHVGTYVFNGNLMAVSSVGAAATVDKKFLDKKKKKK